MDLVRKLIDLYDVEVTMINAPGCRASVDKYKEGYLIIINPYMSQRALERTLLHELMHIVFGHLDERVDIDEEQKESEVQNALFDLGYT